MRFAHATRLSCLAAWATLFAACASGGTVAEPEVSAQEGDPAPLVGAVQEPPVAPTPVAAAPVAPAPEPAACRPLDPRPAGAFPAMPGHLATAELWLCPDAATLDELTARRDVVTGDEGPRWEGDPISVRDGLALYDKAVTGVAMMARVVPVLYPETPRLSAAQVAWLEANPTDAKAFRKLWSARGLKQWRQVQKVLKRHAGDVAALRHMLLRDGAFYVEDTQAARYAYRNFAVGLFFDTPAAWLARGATLFELRRDGEDYRFVDGPRAGSRARLLVHDRVASDRPTLERALAWDLDAMRRAAGLHSFEVETVTADLVEGTAALRHGARLQARGMRLDGRAALAMVAAPDTHAALVPAIATDLRDAAVAEGLVVAAEQLADDQLRFDEPRTEEGQQDGALRHEWRKAYFAGRTHYTFNGDRYRVFTRDGRPYLPEVCIDLVLDIAERWAGTWYASEGEVPERTAGFLDFDDYELRRRKVADVVRFARENPDKLRLTTIPGRERVPFEQRKGFYAMTRGLADRVAIGDTVVIFGLRDDERNHWHAFDVHATDPIAGRPIALVDNAGTVRIRGWFDIMRSAPRRSIRYLVRMEPSWLVGLRDGTSGAASGARLVDAAGVDLDGSVSTQ